jgi:plastocyanin
MASPPAPGTPVAESGDYPDTTGAATEAAKDTDRVEVTIEGFAFAPAMLEIPAGTTIVFTNRDSAPHTVTDSAKPSLFDSGNLAMGDSFEFTFDTPGTYEYFCRIHPTMVATIVVT